MTKQHKKLERLFLFSEVARHLNYSLAADMLDISKGYLSEQVKSLENDLGVQLLVRTTRSVRLTSAGQQVLEHLHIIRRHLLNLERSLDAEKGEIEGIIRITAPAIFANRYLTEIFSCFRKHHPQIEFHLDIGYVRQDLTESPFDVAIRATHQPPENMIGRLLFNYEHWYCAAPTYLANMGTPTHPEDLGSHYCLHSPETKSWFFNDTAFTITGPCIANDPNFQKTMALAGQGIVRAPDYVLAEYVRKGELVRLFSSSISHKQHLFLIYPPSLGTSARLNVFIDYLFEYFEQKIQLNINDLTTK
jgi:DNA-binding transcriptional LysR family regulator